MCANDLTQKALAAIGDASLIDFPDALAWGQWTRHVAFAVNLGDRDWIESLLSKPNKSTPDD